MAAAVVGLHVTAMVRVLLNHDRGLPVGLHVPAVMRVVLNHSHLLAVMRVHVVGVGVHDHLLHVTAVVHAATVVHATSVVGLHVVAAAVVVAVPAMVPSAVVPAEPHAPVPVSVVRHSALSIRFY